MDHPHFEQFAEKTAQRYRSDGYCKTPPIVPPDLVTQAVEHMDRVVSGEYETGHEPHALHFSPEDAPEKIRKVDQPHLCDDTIREVISLPEIGKYAAALTGAKMVQVFAVQLLIKPPGGKSAGHVGWHQDKMYWPYWQGTEGLLTAWMALSDVTLNSGPIRFVRGPHRWGLCEGANFFEPDHENQKRAIKLPPGETWEEEALPLSPGEVSFHHCLTFHASGPNLESYPRRSFALHLRTDQADVASNEYYTEHLDDPIHAPIIYQA